MNGGGESVPAIDVTCDHDTNSVQLVIRHDNLAFSMLFDPEDARKVAASLTQMSIHVEERQ